MTQKHTTNIAQHQRESKGSSQQVRPVFYATLIALALQMDFSRVMVFLTAMCVTVVITVYCKLFSEVSYSPVFIMKNNSSTYISLRGRSFSFCQQQDTTSPNCLLLQEVRQSAQHRDIANVSLDYNITARGEFQRSRLRDFCVRQKLTNHTTNINLRRFLYDDSKRVVFCYVPKNGCSNFKWMLLRLNGVVPMNRTRRPPEDVLRNQVHRLSELNETEVHYRLQHYYKMVIVRNPMVRLLSAYKNKLEPPVNYKNKHIYQETLKLQILESYQKEKLDKWLKKGNFSTDIHPSFNAYIRYMTDHPLNEYNEHFTPVFQLCSPCAVEYDFFANFKVLDYDIYAAMDFLGISEKYYPHNIAHPRKSTAEYAESYYAKLSGYDKSRLFKQFEKELDFYYSLYPEDKDYHKAL